MNVLIGLAMASVLFFAAAWIRGRRRISALFLSFFVILALAMLLSVTARERHSHRVNEAQGYLLGVLSGNLPLELSAISSNIQREDMLGFFSGEIPDVRDITYGWKFADRVRMLDVIEMLPRNSHDTTHFRYVLEYLA